MIIPHCEGALRPGQHTPDLSGDLEALSRYQAPLVRNYLAARVATEGATWSFHEEETPLGTAGAVAYVSSGVELLIVCNGDVLADVDFAELVATHRRSGANATVLAISHDIKWPYGELETDGNGTLLQWHEKPTIRRQASGGIYVLDREVIGLVKRGKRVEMPELIRQANDQGLRVGIYEHCGAWFDIGQTDQYLAALEAFQFEPKRFLPEEQVDVSS